MDCLEQDGNGRTALHYAVQSASKELVQMLIVEGADPKVMDKDGFSPFIMYL